MIFWICGKRDTRIFEFSLQFFYLGIQAFLGHSSIANFYQQLVLNRVIYHSHKCFEKIFFTKCAEVSSHVTLKGVSLKFWLQKKGRSFHCFIAFSYFVVFVVGYCNEMQSNQNIGKIFAKVRKTFFIGAKKTYAQVSEKASSWSQGVHLCSLQHENMHLFTIKFLLPKTGFYFVLKS